MLSYSSQDGDGKYLMTKYFTEEELNEIITIDEKTNKQIWEHDDEDAFKKGLKLTKREFEFGGNKAFSVGLKVTAAGNKRYGPVDSTLSIATGEIVYIDSLRNTLQLDDYFRMDLKINYKINQEKVTHEIGLDIVNVLNTKNVLKLTYAPDPQDPGANAIREEYQLGLLPIFYYKIDF